MNSEHKRMKTEDAAAYFVTKYRLWRALKRAGNSISFQAVYQWKENVPEEWAFKLSAISHGEIPMRGDNVN